MAGREDGGNPMRVPESTYLVLAATGRTGRYFVSLALRDGHRVRALVRNPEKIEGQSPNLELHQGSVSDYDRIDELVHGAHFVVCMLGDAQLQRNQKMNTLFVKRLVPAMRRQGVKRLLYQAGGLTRRYKERLPFLHWILRSTIARHAGLVGQHEDNEAVIEYLVEEAQDIDWIVHRASIISDGPSRGVLQRSTKRASPATFRDCPTYNYRILTDDSAIHSCDLSCYVK